MSIWRVEDYIIPSALLRHLLDYARFNLCFVFLPSKEWDQDSGDLVLWLNIHVCPKRNLLFYKKKNACSVFATCNLNGRAWPMFVFSLTFGFNHFNFPKRKQLLNFGTYHFTISPFRHFVISPFCVLNTPEFWNGNMIPIILWNKKAYWAF